MHEPARLFELSPKLGPPDTIVLLWRTGVYSAGQSPGRAESVEDPLACNRIHEPTGVTDERPVVSPARDPPTPRVDDRRYERAVSLPRCRVEMREVFLQQVQQAFSRLAPLRGSSLPTPQTQSNRQVILTRKEPQVAARVPKEFRLDAVQLRRDQKTARDRGLKARKIGNQRIAREAHRTISPDEEIKPMLLVLSHQPPPVTHRLNRLHFSVHARCSCSLGAHANRLVERFSFEDQRVARTRELDLPIGRRQKPKLMHPAGQRRDLFDPRELGLSFHCDPAAARLLPRRTMVKERHLVSLNGSLPGGIRAGRAGADDSDPQALHGSRSGSRSNRPRPSRRRYASG